ncbi:MAG: phosphoribosylformylglycinamidine synthase, partial [Clostridiales bacterium]|nr:phosphoribosylformylglycinamidine synthase [Clostridiales bacterium]
NETHNHPTEIEPFGGAATCIGGAIRDPLSGRTYVYQAMRVTGAANPLTPIEETIPGKLPQRKIVTTAAAGYSSYGNQIGLATGLVEEIYHPGYAAKRMEVGAVLGAAPKKNVVREVPAPGDVVVLVGGRTGRDGCGGATGSSKSHTVESLESCGAEVQKGNPVVERKLQRLFRNPQVSRIIKRCNDFGAGGVSVAVGELADGLEIDLNKVPKKYEGLNGTELAISESQERMAVVLDPKDVEFFMHSAQEENVEATVIAKVTEKSYMIMHHNGETIVSLSREFLNSNGAPKKSKAKVLAQQVAQPELPQGSFQEQCEQWMSQLTMASQQGLSERFDSTIGAGTVIMPFGGKYQKTPSQSMIAKIPVLEGETTTCSLMAYGYNPYISQQSPYIGAYYAVVESIAKVVASGFSKDTVYLTFQEYFQRLEEDPLRWGKPVAALLGALEAQLAFKAAAIGGKDSMSGTFEELHVPPTLISFAVATGESGHISTPHFKKPGSTLYLIKSSPLENPTEFLTICDSIYTSIQKKEILSTYAINKGGLLEGVCKASMGNRIGARLSNLSKEELYHWQYGSFLVESDQELSYGEKIGETTESYELVFENETADLASVEKAYDGTLETVFPRKAKKEGDTSLPIQIEER